MRQCGAGSVAVCNFILKGKWWRWQLCLCFIVKKSNGKSVFCWWTSVFIWIQPSHFVNKCLFAPIKVKQSQKTGGWQWNCKSSCDSCQRPNRGVNLCYCPCSDSWCPAEGTENPARRRPQNLQRHSRKYANVWIFKDYFFNLIYEYIDNIGD